MEQLLNLASEPTTLIGFAAGVPTGMGILIALVVLGLRRADTSPRYRSGGHVSSVVHAEPSEAQQARIANAAARAWPATNSRAWW